MQLMTDWFENLGSVSIAGQSLPLGASGDVDFLKIAPWIGVGLALIGLTVLILSRYLNMAIGWVSILGLVVLVGATISIPQVVQLAISPTRTDTQAEEAAKPLDVRITNVRATEFSVEWTTQDLSIGGVRYGLNPANLNEAAVELSPTQKKTTHLVRITNLTPGQTYYARLISGGTEFTSPELQLSVTLPN